MKGASASFARRRAISVLPTPVGPIMSMFFGVISWRRGSATCCRRQRFRSAMATARLARSWPMMCLSSSWTISCGVMCDMAYSRKELDNAGLASVSSLKGFDHELLVGIDANVGGDAQRRRRRGRRGGPAGADGDQAEFRFEHVADAGNNERGFAIRHGQHRLQAPQYAVGAPVLGQFH